MNFSGVALSHLCPKSMSYHFIRLSGLCGKTSVAREHRLLCKLIRLLHQYDQCDITNIAQCRCRTRHTIQLEAATRRNPWAPDSRDWTSSWTPPSMSTDAPSFQSLPLGLRTSSGTKGSRRRPPGNGGRNRRACEKEQTRTIRRMASGYSTISLSLSCRCDRFAWRTRVCAGLLCASSGSLDKPFWLCYTVFNFDTASLWVGLVEK
jgi:hypothetical protein